MWYEESSLVLSCRFTISPYLVQVCYNSQCGTVNHMADLTKQCPGIDNLCSLPIILITFHVDRVSARLPLISLSHFMTQCGSSDAVPSGSRIVKFISKLGWTYIIHVQTNRIMQYFTTTHSIDSRVNWCKSPSFVLRNLLDRAVEQPCSLSRVASFGNQFPSN